jgi:asparagine synthase (glutamine-hydrolysing)
MLNGQFAFAIWDKVKEELFVARDRVGIRPLFYHTSNGRLMFASEIKSLFQSKDIVPEFDYRGLLQIYTFWTALTPNTAFKNISELSPGEYLFYNREGIKKQKYWELSFAKKDSTISLAEATDHFEEIFSDSLRIRLRADVPVAAYLSGGLDSTTSVAYIKKTEPGILNTFSVAFDDEEFDERNYQAEAVNYLGTLHKSVSCSSSDIAALFPRVIWHAEAPVMRTAPAPMLQLSRLVSDNNIKVVITGEGADEILAGYNIFKEAIIRQFWSSQPDSYLRPLLLKKLYPYLPQINQATSNILKMFFGFRLQDTGNPVYSHIIRWNNSNQVIKHLSEDFRSQVRDYSPQEQLISMLPSGFDTWNLLAKAQWLETTLLMSGYLLSSQGDRMALANSVESRYPFLDYRLIEFCSSLPEKFKLNGLTEKYLLKKIAKEIIPEAIINRPKQAYRAPVKNVFLADDAPEYIKEMLSKELFDRTGVFNYNSVKFLLDKIKNVGKSSEVENMLVTFVVSTHLLADQFVFQRAPFTTLVKLNKIKVIEDF